MSSSLKMHQEDCPRLSLSPRKGDTISPVDTGIAGQGSEERHSHASSSTDLPLPNMGNGESVEVDPNDPSKGSHHLLKHCLTQRYEEALSHFSNMDVKDAAREIGRMGQRDLQAKFRLVYGAPTHSNNNEWLRRKLYEAIGAMPMKANNRSKARKPTTHQLPRIRTGLSPPVDEGSGQLTPIGTTSPRRTLRSPSSTPRHLITAALKRRLSLLPASPRFASVLDNHKSISDETDDDEEMELNGGAPDDEGSTGNTFAHHAATVVEQPYGRYSQARQQSPFVPASAPNMRRSWQQQSSNVMQRNSSTADLLKRMDLALGESEWRKTNEALQFRPQPLTAPTCTTASTIKFDEYDGVTMLSMDLSAFDG